MAKTPAPAKDEFETWLTTTVRIQFGCKTCQEAPEILGAIQRYWERSQAGSQVPPKTQLLYFLRTNYNYPLAITALSNHLQNCLPAKRGLKSE